ncbi:hypothetical protein vseg_018271 [Gypsophila vaccaria]
MANETKIPATRGGSDEMPSFSETIFGFLDENYPSSESSTDKFEEVLWVDDDQEEDESIFNERKAYWDEQQKHLNGILCRTSSIELNVRNATNEAIQQVKGTIICNCRTDVFDGCRDCFRRRVFDRLCNAGFNCLVQKSTWKRCRKIPSGEHTYLEVVEKSSGSKEEVRVIIELNFRAQFEMGRASQEYNQLIQKLPQVYVGKHERLIKIIKILCSAAKKCMKDQKLHLAPWRKHEYMQSKWLNSCNEFIFATNTATTMTAAAVPRVVIDISNKQVVKSRASLLTQSLTGELSASRCQFIKVL